MSLELEAAAAWEALPKPVTKSAFVEWYVSAAPHGTGGGIIASGMSQTKKRRADAPPTAISDDAALSITGAPPESAPVARPTATAAPINTRQAKAPAATKALQKGLVKALHQATKAKARWHKGDCEIISAAIVMTPEDFAALLQSADVALTITSPIITTFTLSSAQLTTLLGADKMSCNVRTWSRGGGFRKTYATGPAPVEYQSAEGKYSRATSTMTLKVQSSCAISFSDLFDAFL
jgi:hypothetical protein